MRSNILSIFAVGAVLALPCLGMKYRTDGWVGGIVALSLFVYVAAGVCAVKLSGRNRVFAIAFAAVGAIYLGLAMSASIRYYLPTSRALALVWKVLWDEHIFIPSNTNELAHFTEFSRSYSVDDVVSASSIKRKLVYAPYLRAYVFTYPYGTAYMQSARAFSLIGHCVWSWPLALLTGWFCRGLYAKREAKRAVASQAARPTTVAPPATN